jgi:hypothetical protein
LTTAATGCWEFKWIAIRNWLEDYCSGARTQSGCVDARPCARCAAM